MNTRLHVVVDREDEQIVQDVKNALNLLCPAFSFSPSREQPSLCHCLEFFGTAVLTEQEIESLLRKCFILMFTIFNFKYYRKGAHFRAPFFVVSLRH